MMHDKLVAWWRVTRYHYCTSSFLPAGVAGCMAWATSDSFSWLWFIAAIVGLTFNQLALNMTDDYFDYLNGIDRFKNEALHVYTSGSGVLAAGTVTPDQVRRAFLLCYALGVSIGLLILASGKWWLLAFLAFGLFYSYFYTAPPIKLAYRGLGEVGFILSDTGGLEGHCRTGVPCAGRPAFSNLRRPKPIPLEPEPGHGVPDSGWAHISCGTRLPPCC